MQNKTLGDVTKEYVDNQINNKQELTPEEKFVRLVVYALVGGFSLLVLSLTTCTMHSNTFDGERLRENSKAAQIGAEGVKIKNSQVQFELNAISKMVENGVDPISARCGIIGWSKNDNTCLIGAKQPN